MNGNADKDEIIRGLTARYRPGDVFEIRALNAIAPGGRYRRTVSGYFDYEHIPDAAGQICALRDYSGVYSTLAPVDKALLARAVNRLRAVSQGDPTTTDRETLRRRWLLVDCDPERPSGISSTDDEHVLALRKAEEVRNGLASLGWPPPVMLDSGNGAQMMYSIDLPADDGGLVRSVLEQIAKASDSRVGIDTTVHNAARICRLPGTYNRKGDDTEERPHRMAKILSVPGSIRRVTEEQLRAVAESGTPEPAPSVRGGTFDIDNWIAEHLPDAGPPQEYRGGRKWVLKVCPFNPAHANKSAVITQGADGALGFRCHHNGCTGNDWHKLRELLEPGCHGERGAHPDVDLSGFRLPEAEGKPVPKKKRKRDAGFAVPPEHLLHIPGFIDEFVEWAMAAAPYPNRVLEFCGALAFLSYAVGRGIACDRDTLPNIYLIVLAESGTGKDLPRKANMTAAVECGIAGGIVEDFTSGASIEDALSTHPVTLLQKDEFDTLFNVIKMSKDPNAEMLLSRLLSIYGASNGFYKLRCKARDRKDIIREREEMRQGIFRDKAQIINYPYLVIFGTAIPQFFFESLSQRLLSNGMAARCIILSAGERTGGSKSRRLVMPDHLRLQIDVMRSYGGSGNLTNINPQMETMQTLPEADRMLDEAGRKFDGLYRESGNNAAAKSFWCRALEKTIKLSMLYAISGNVVSPKITPEAVRWAEEFVTFTTEQTLALADDYTYDNPFDEKCRKVMRYIKENGGEYDHSRLLRYSHESKEDFKKIIETLAESEVIETAYEGTGHESRKVYRMKNANR